MTPIKKHIGNFSSLLSADAISALLLAIFTIILAREQGEVPLGILSAAFAVALLFRTVVEAGFDISIARDIGSGKEISPRQLKYISFVKNILWLWILLPGGIVAYFVTSQSSAILMIIYILPLSVASSYRAIFRGMRQMRYVMEVEVVINLLLTTINLLLVYFYFDIKLVFSAFFGAELAKSVYYNAKLRKVSGINYRWQNQYEIPSVYFRSRSFRRVLHYRVKQQLALMKVAFFSSAQARMPLLALGTVSSASVLGIFSAPMRILNFSRLLPGAAMNFLIPELSSKSPENIKPFLNKIIALAFIGGGLASAFLYIFAEEIVIIIFTDKFAESIIVMRILSFLVVMQLINHVLESYLIVIKYEKFVNMTLIISALVILIGVITLAGSYAAVGAAYAAVAGEALMIMMYLYAIRSGKNVRKKEK